jgi:branched-subunit amino acid aminotransferase/4-amino-4-deoxychorismate lyase
VKRAQVIRELLRRCSESDAVFRYTVTGGANHGPTEILTSRPLPASNLSEGICLRVLRLRRDSGEWIPRPKSLNYLNASLGLRELSMRSAAPSDEGLFLAREDDFVVETARQSIAWVVGDRIYTPGESSGAVSGTCLAWLQTCDVAIVRTRAALATFLEANAIFVLNAVRGITPVAAVWDEFDGKQLGSYESAAHPLILQLQRGWNDELAKTAQDCVAS